MSQSRSLSSTPCRYFLATGNCYYGDKCNFSHVGWNEYSDNSSTLDKASSATRSTTFSMVNTTTGPSSIGQGSKMKNQTLCRNIALYGYCKFQDNGCAFSHDLTTKSEAKPGETSHKTTISFRDVVKDENEYSSTNRDDHKSEIHDQKDTDENDNKVQNRKLASDTLEESLNELEIEQDQQMNRNRMDRNDQSNRIPIPKVNEISEDLETSMGNLSLENPSQLQPSVSPFVTNALSSNVRVTTNGQKGISSVVASDDTSLKISNRGGTTYFYGPEEETISHSRTPLLLYNPNGPSLAHTSSSSSSHVPCGRRRLQSFFVSENLRRELLQRTLLLHRTLSEEDNRYKQLPQTVHHYHSLYPLDWPSRPLNSGVYAYATSVYQCTSLVDGLPYVLRKVEGFRLSNQDALRHAELWKLFYHPNVVGLHEIFISKDFGDLNALFFVYHYHPGSVTLEEKYFSASSVQTFLSEDILWSFIVQLVSAIRAVHSAGLACRVIVPSKILLTGKNRIRLNGVGIADVINYDGGVDISYRQHEDLLALGLLVLCLASGTMTALQSPQKSLEFVASRYSAELKNFLIFLLSKPIGLNYPSINDLLQMLIVPMMNEMESLYSYDDVLEAELSKEIENGRLLRILVKLGFINERPEYGMDSRWSETGDRYLLKLLRDYIFHQVYEDGRPIIDFAHVIECLNKLDVGSPEKVVLMSRDEQSILIVSYKDLNRCIHETFRELVEQKPAPQIPLTNVYRPATINTTFS